MSSKTTLTDFLGAEPESPETEPEPESEPERANLDDIDDDVLRKWQPGVHPRRCNNCDSHVTSEFRRAASDGDGIVHRCPNCASGVEISGGAAAGVDVRSIDQGGLSLGSNL